MELVEEVGTSNTGIVQGWAMKRKDFKATYPYFLSVSLPNPVQ
jgi:hypothetical protein